jgi:hypothetical protein
MRGSIRARGTVAALAAVVSVLGASPAAASVTVGQVAAAPFGGCAGNTDSTALSVSTGASYAVPAAGTITSWSTNAGAGAGQMYELKIYRQVTGLAYSVVAHDGPRPLVTTPVHALSTFTTSIPVKKGDLVGWHTIGAGTDCVDVGAPADTRLFRLASDLADGATGTFTTVSNSRPNIAATLDPTNTFTLGSIVLNKSKGTAAIAVTVSNPGKVSVSGKGLKKASKTAAFAGQIVALKLKASGKQQKTLNKSGKVKVKAKISFTPTGGTATSQNRKLKLKKKQ